MSKDNFDEQAINDIASKIISSKKYSDIDDNFIISLVKSYSIRYPIKLLEEKVRTKLHQIRGAYFSESLNIDKILSKFPSLNTDVNTYQTHKNNDDNDYYNNDFMLMLEYIISLHASTKERSIQSGILWDEIFDVYKSTFNKNIKSINDLGCGVNFASYILWLLKKFNNQYDSESKKGLEEKVESIQNLTGIKENFIVNYYEGWDIGKSELDISEYISRIFVANYLEKTPIIFEDKFSKKILLGKDTEFEKSSTGKGASIKQLFNGIASDIMNYPEKEKVLNNNQLGEDQFNCILLLKVLQNLEQVQNGNAMKLLSRIDADLLVVSFPSKSLGGKSKDMNTNYTAWFIELLSHTDYTIIKQSNIGSDIVFYSIKK